MERCTRPGIRPTRVKWWRLKRCECHWRKRACPCRRSARFPFSNRWKNTNTPTSSGKLFIFIFFFFFVIYNSPSVFKLEKKKKEKKNNCAFLLFPFFIAFAKCPDGIWWLNLKKSAKQKKFWKCSGADPKVRWVSVNTTKFLQQGPKRKIKTILSITTFQFFSRFLSILNLFVWPRPVATIRNNKGAISFHHCNFLGIFRIDCGGFGLSHFNRIRGGF